ncbi:MAG: zinc-ribbon domain containing protein [Acidobacteriota bacterium]|nr:zinc-ribbon domain containing protein [Acidobacteriota bacterium]
MDFVDRILICADCGGEFIFTAGEQLFFVDKQFKNDPKRCKPCKSRRSGGTVAATGSGPAAAGLSRTETRTECSECGVSTTVPFKPTQGRPVLCRQCFKTKRAPSVAAPETVAATHELVAAAAAVLVAAPLGVVDHPPAVAGELGTSAQAS